MQEYIRKIEEAELPGIVTFQLKVLCHVVEQVEKLKAEGREADRNWLKLKLSEHGIE